MKNCAEEVLYLGHAEDHSKETVRLLKLSTKRVVRSRDVRWLEKTYKEFCLDDGRDFQEYDGADDDSTASYDSDLDSLPDLVQREDDSDSDSDDDDDEDTKVVDVTSSSNQSRKSGTRTRSSVRFDPRTPIRVNDPKAQRELRRLDTHYNPVPKELLDVDLPDDNNNNNEKKEDNETNNQSGREEGGEVTHIVTDYLQNEMAFYVLESPEPEIVLTAATDYNKIKAKISSMHLCDA